MALKDDGTFEVRYTDNPAPARTIDTNFEGTAVEVLWVDADTYVGNPASGRGAVGNARVIIAEGVGSAAAGFVFIADFGLRSDGTDSDGAAHTTFLIGGSYGIDIRVRINGGFVEVVIFRGQNDSISTANLGTLSAMLSNGESSLRVSLTVDNASFFEEMTVTLSSTGRVVEGTDLGSLLTLVGITEVEHWSDYDKAGGEPILISFQYAAVIWGSGVNCLDPTVFDIDFGAQNSGASGSVGAGYTFPPILGESGGPIDAFGESAENVEGGVVFARLEQL